MSLAAAKQLFFSKFSRLYPLPPTAAVGRKKVSSSSNPPNPAAALVFSKNVLGASLNFLAVYVGKVSLAAAKQLFQKFIRRYASAADRRRHGADPTLTLLSPAAPELFRSECMVFHQGGSKWEFCDSGP